NAGQITIPFVVVEPVADHEFVFDLKAKIISVDLSRAPLLLAQEHADANAARSRRFEFLPNGGERVSAVENVVQNENVSIFHVRRRNLFEITSQLVCALPW